MSDEELVEALKALAHPVRLRIMKVLTGTERNVGEIDDAAEIGQPTLSQQLAVLRNAGLVKTRKDAKLVYYRIDDDRLSKVVDAAGDLAGCLPHRYATHDSRHRGWPTLPNWGEALLR